MMKKIFISIIILAAICSCKKSVSHSYYGEWKLVKIDWTFLERAGYYIPSSDSLVTLDLNINKRYSYSVNGVEQTSGNFNIKSSDNSDEIDMVQSVPNPNEVAAQHIFFRNDTLVLSPLPNPAGATFYSYLRR